MSRYSASLLAFLLASCGANQAPTALQQTEVSADALAQQSCAQIAKTRDDAIGCINAVRNYWCGDGGALHSAGACAYGLDAGSDR